MEAMRRTRGDDEGHKGDDDGHKGDDNGHKGDDDGHKGDDDGHDGDDEAHNGDVEGQTELDIVDAGHALAAGLAGRVKVTTSPQTFGWGRPATAARKIARIVDRPEAGKSGRQPRAHRAKWGVFAYEKGEVMVDMAAPARRVGWFAGREAPAAFTDNAWKLFDAAIRWATMPRALFVVGATPLRPADASIRSRLERNCGLAVDVRLATALRTSDVTGMDVVVISDTARSDDIGSRFRTIPVPMVILEPSLWGDMKMVGDVGQTDFGKAFDQMQIDIVDAAHPLAAGLSGRVTVTSSGQEFGWGAPGPEAKRVATIVGRADQLAIFSYEPGANMLGLKAPAPRVGWFAGGDAAASFTADGWRLFDAAVGWASIRRHC
jgi:hypothetical protein